MPTPREVRQPAASGWAVRLLGSFEVTVDTVSVDASQWRLRKAKSVVAMLALAPAQRRHREQMLESLWPDLEPLAAAKNLHQTLYVARRAIAGTETSKSGLLAIRDEQVVLDDSGPVEVDVVQFERAAREALHLGDETALRAAAELYRGDVLPEWPDADWLGSRRHELREVHREILVKLASVVRRRAPEEALVMLTRVLEADPLHEGAVRAVMELLARMGRRSEALARYERLVDDLLDAFGTDPDSQTSMVFRELLTGAAMQDASPTSAGHDDVGSLPTPLTSFVGRERELADVERLIAHARLLTLTGAGGSGKTRLAVEAALRVRSDYPDGVWFVDLATVGESLHVPDAVAEALGLDPAAGLDREQALVDQLRSRRVLIVLDNCEHLIAACARLVAALLAGCRGVDVLATSREPLHTHGEYTFRVPSLALPSPDADLTDLAELTRLPSISLFAARAAQVRPGFALDTDNAPGVVELCRRLDGMPLALELAAARAVALEPAEIVQRLGDALSMRSTGPGGITRHQTLRGTLEWSHDLLSEPEQVLLRRLSVFSGSFTLDAVESVCGDAPLARTSVFEVLARLVDKSLVVPERTADGTRYRQLETVRQFGAEQLAQTEPAGRLAAEHSAYFLEVAAAHNPERSTGVVIDAPRALDLEHDNLRAALRWSCIHDPDTALRLGANLWRFWFVRGHAIEGARWLERALAVTPDPTRPRAAALIGLTGLDSRQGRSDRHRSLGAQATAIMRRIGTPDEQVMAQIMEATLAWSTFDLDDAEALADGVRSQADASGRAEFAAAGSWILGQCALFRENPALAADRFDTCLRELAASDPAARPFFPVVTTCMLLVPIGGRTVPTIEETMLVSRRVGADQAIGYVLSALGYAHRMDGDLPAAISAVDEAIQRFDRLGDDLARAQALNQLGCTHRDRGDFESAQAALSRARELRLGLGDRRGQLLTEINVAVLHAMSGDVDQGLHDARRSLSGFEANGDQVGMGAASLALAAAELLSGETRAAREMYSQAAQRLAPWRRAVGWLRLMVAELSDELGDPRRAVRELNMVAPDFEQAGCMIAARRLSALQAGLAGRR